MRTPSLKTSMKRLALPLLVAGAAFALSAIPAQASAIQVIRDCSEDGSLDRKYSQDELSGALDDLPSDLDEYTDCRSVIRAAQLAGAGGKNAGKRGGVVGAVDAGAPPSAREERELAQAQGADEAVEIGGRRLRPGATGAPFAAAGLGTDLPVPILLLLLALGLAIAAAGALAAQRRWPGAWQAAGSRLGSGVDRIRGRRGRGDSRRR
jgi:hypothetical protein